MSQLFGDRALIANATGCTSIYGGNLPTTPYSANADGRGPAWSNSLFEDCASSAWASGWPSISRPSTPKSCSRGWPGSSATSGSKRCWSRPRRTRSRSTLSAGVAGLKSFLEGLGTPEARQFLAVADALVRRSVWLVGGDGWAYDIGFGGLDHVLATGRDVNILVLDTEVYSNTGGQASKSTPRARWPSSPPRAKRPPRRTWA